MTLKALYQAVTGDADLHQRTIGAHFARLDPRRQAIVRARLAGRTLRDIAAPLRLTAAAIKSAIDGAMRKIHHDARGLPRYTVSRKGTGPTSPANQPATPPANDRTARRAAEVATPDRPRARRKS